jgi:uncharacterized membrane protein YiaA
MDLCSLLYLLHAMLLFSFVVITGKSTNHEAPRYLVSTNLLLLTSFNTQYTEHNDGVFYIAFFMCLLMTEYFSS